MGSGHSHSHAGSGTAAGRHRGRLLAVLLISVCIFVVEVVGGLLSGSLALLADAGHMLTDSVGLGLALLAITLAQRPATLRRTYGLARAEILAAAVNAVFLAAVGVYVLVEGARRLMEPADVQSGAMLVYGAIGLAGNLVGLWLLSGTQRDSLNMRGAFLEVAADAVSSVGVLVAALLMRYTAFQRADAVVAVAIAVFILPRALRLLKESVDVLLEATPKDVDLAEVRAHIVAMPRVLDVHDLHASTVTSGLPVLSAHVVIDAACFYDGEAPRMLDELQRCLRGDFDVEHSTFQLEPAGHGAHEEATHA